MQNDNNLRDLHKFALTFLETSRDIIKKYKRNSSSLYELKGDGSLVTPVDREIEERFRNIVGERFPDHSVLGEEFQEVLKSSDYEWIIDPIDGTEDFVYNHSTYGTIIGLKVKGENVLGVLDLPELDLCVSTYKGGGIFKNNSQIESSNLFRGPLKSKNLKICTNAPKYFLPFNLRATLGNLLNEFPNLNVACSCYKQAYTVLGGYDVALEVGGKDWDLAAAEILMKESGKEYQVIHSEIIDGNKAYIAAMGKSELVQKVVNIVKDGLNKIKG